MSSRTFHPFPKLPYELRLLIWEASCFNGNEKTRHGLNYVDVSDTDDIKCRPADDTTTSDCLMDTGLWEACDESKAVMIKQFEERGLLSADLPICRNQGRWLRAPAHIQTPVLISGRDLFYFRIFDWYTRQLRREDRREIGTAAFDFHLDRYQGISQAKVCNLAFELDVVGWGQYSSVWRVISLALAQAFLQSRTSWGESVTVSIIDKDVHWYRDDHTVIDVIYADSNDDYTLVSWKNLCYCDQTAVGIGAHALRKYTYFSHLMEEMVKILVRRDNENGVLSHQKK
ncbi:hypothetical protein NW766_011575 [Fusarium irregulare]|uniref:2EXR domain-containing protein n=1 Tax=Fusarium irregulare TaxID=2494466 RepID=A0A9W8PGB3_9HYPO|nr:hypothetical protein NW766_011575 [Fusarium irregulare]